jgi:hypothetical protein
VSSHRLRHSFAIHSLRGGMDIVTLQRAMGHRCLTSTVRYLTPDLARPGTTVDARRHGPADRPFLLLPRRIAGECWNNYDITGAPRHPWRQPSPHETVTNKEDPDDRMRSTRSLAREPTPTH